MMMYYRLVTGSYRSGHNGAALKADAALKGSGSSNLSLPATLIGGLAQ